MIKNRLQKNQKKLQPWAKRHGIGAYRLYDRDIPEYPYIVDIYHLEGDLSPHVVMADRRETIDFTEEKSARFEEIMVALRELLQPVDIIVKRRNPQRQKSNKSDQYQKVNTKGERRIVREDPARFAVNLYDYLDTGLFLDHRLLRQKVFNWIRKRAESVTAPRFLNLFSYTGSVSVFAALGGAQTTSVDLSKTYTEWARENFKLNNLSGHEFIAADVREWLEQKSIDKLYDLIYIDPPTFSNSKSMKKSLTGFENFEVERDQVPLLKAVMRLLKPDGLLIFSNNKRGFKLNPELNDLARVKNVSQETLPFDFHDKKVRHVFELTRI